MDFIVNSNAAFFMAAERHRLPHKFFLSVKGTITSLTNMLRVKNDKVFLIELDNCVFLLVKDFHLEWFSLLKINNTYLFKNLRLTMLEKGVKKPCAVFFVWKSSSFVQIETEETSIVVQKDWLDRHGITCDTSKLEESKCRNKAHLLSYQGIVTCCDKSSIGFYILDKKVGLYIGLSEYYKSKLKLHSQVTLYNVHIFKGLETTLVCCVKTTINFENSFDGQFCDLMNVSDDLEETVFHFGLNFQEVEKLKEIHHYVLTKHGKSKRKAYYIANCIVKKIFNDEMGQNFKVSAIDCFLNHDDCPWLHFPLSRCLLPDVLHLSSLMNDITISSFPPASYCFSDKHCKCWKYRPSDSQILIGSIQTSTIGNLVFSDGSHQLPLILLQKSLVTEVNQNYEVHLCSDTCLKCPSFGTNFLCPLITSKILGKLISVQCFCIILEECKSYAGNSYDTTSTKGALIYLSFCLCDCLVLDTFSEHDSSVTHEQTSLVTLKTNNLEGGSPEILTSMVAYITEKHALKIRNTQTNNSTFDVVGYGISLFNDCKKPTCYSSSSKNINSAHNKNLNSYEKQNGRLPSSSSPEVIVSQQGNHLHTQLKVIEDKELLNNILTSFSDEFINLNNGGLKPVLITFEEGFLYDLVVPGHIYNLCARMEQGSVNSFEAKFENNLLQAAADQSNLRLRIVAPLNTTLQKLSTSAQISSNAHSYEKIHHLSEVCCQGFSDSIVSFQAVIVSYDTDMPAFLGSHSGTHNKQLNVTEISSLVTDGGIGCNFVTSVYMDAPQIVYSLGLIPGALVHFHRLQRKLSRMGNVYFRFVTLSSVEVIGLCKISARKAIVVQQPGNVSMYPKETLLNIWLKGPTVCHQKYEIECNICMFFRLTIKAMCLKCSMLWVNNRCRGCGNSDLYFVEANALILLDDGTNQASARAKNSQLVQQLLTLTENQWEGIVDAALKEGELIVTKVHGAYTSPVNWFLSTLTNSPVVLKPCRMIIKTSKFTSWAKTLEESNIKDLQMREEKIGKNRFFTHSPPLLQVECLAVQDIY